MTKRKKTKEASESSVTDETPAASAQSESPQQGKIDTFNDPPQPVNRSSWTWRSKASPIAQIARESVSFAQGATSETSDAKPVPSSISKRSPGSRKSIPLAAEATKVHATSRPSLSSEGTAKDDQNAKEMVVEKARLPPDPVAVDRAAKVRDVAARASWLGWWSRPDGYASDGERERRKAKRQKLETEAEEVASGTPLPGTPADEGPDPGLQNTQDSKGVESAVKEVLAFTVPSDFTAAQIAPRSWFGLWSTTQNQKAAAEKQQTKPGAEEVPQIEITAEPPQVEDAFKAEEGSNPGDEEQTDGFLKPSGWAFWSSAGRQDAVPTPGGTQKQIGELAVADTPSQSNPEVAQFNEERQKQQSDSARTKSLLRPQRGRTQKPKDHVEDSSTPMPSSADQSPAPSAITTPAETPPLVAIDAQPSKKRRPAQPRPNLILPSFRDTFPSAPNPGYIERLTQYLASSLHIPGSQAGDTTQHVFISPSPSKIKKAVAIGVHGFFPGALVQKVLGSPTGTSIKFANYAATSIKTWCREHQPDVRNVEIEKVALEGEGYVSDRVEMLWKLLLNWRSYIEKANSILVACHSQGVPVGCMLVAKLIELGCLSANTRVGICAMAGISLGPFLEYKSRLWGGSAFELFEFCDSTSKVSKMYADSLDICLRHGVRMTYIGSIDDQLVSIESSLHAPLSHPYVARAVFIDGRLHAPNFLTHLVVFVLRLRNLGVSDHGLLRELSGPLAGSLVGGEGHSRIYDDPAVYDLATQFALETTDASSNAPGAFSGQSAKGIAPKIGTFQPPPTSTSVNPFYLPWAVRGVLEEDLVRKDPKLREEVEVLVKEFDEWKPTSKVLKDVRWRLEGIRSMQ